MRNTFLLMQEMNIPTELITITNSLEKYVYSKLACILKQYLLFGSFWTFGGFNVFIYLFTLWI